MLEINDLSLKYGSRTILQSLNWRIAPDIYALTGKNGCGKTTLLECLAGIKAPSQGQVLVNGVDLYRKPVEVKMKLSYMPDKPYVFPTMTAKDLLKLVAFAKYLDKKNVEREIEHYLTCFNVAEYLNTQFSQMSLGTQRKFTLIAALLGRPGLLLLDEPTNGLDKDACVDFVKIITREIENGSIVLMSTHSRELIQSVNAKELCLEGGGALCH